MTDERGHPATGRGLVSGLATTARALFRPTHTAEYPHVRPELPPRSRGVIALLAENCTSCMLCARECPDWCIYIESHKEEVPAATTGGRARPKNVLDRFAIDFSLCMYCGICIEVCPFDALFWSSEFEYAEFDIRDLLHESDRLESWMSGVQPPPLLDPGAVEAKEVGAARAAAEKAIAAYGASLAKTAVVTSGDEATEQSSTVDARAGSRGEVTEELLLEDARGDSGGEVTEVGEEVAEKPGPPEKGGRERKPGRASSINERTAEMPSVTDDTEVFPAVADTPNDPERPA